MWYQSDFVIRHKQTCCGTILIFSGQWPNSGQAKMVQSNSLRFSLPMWWCSDIVEVCGLPGVGAVTTMCSCSPFSTCVKQWLRPPAQSFRRWLSSQSSSLSDCNFKITLCFSRTWQNFSKSFKIVVQKRSFLVQLKTKRRRKSGLKWTVCLRAGFLFCFFF